MKNIVRNEEPIKLFCRGCGEKLDVGELEPFTRTNCPTCGTSIRVPKRFDRYLLEKICGIGGMSKVYRAIDPDLARRVAIKILNEEFHAEYHGCEQFIYEANLLARIEHPGIIPIFDCGMYNGEAFLVMRYMEHGSLEMMLKARELPEIPVICNWIATIAAGLQYALRMNVLHHDIKPGNILVADDGEAGLGDFDLADVRENPESILASTGWASLAYVSPERLSDGSEDWHGDVFSLGVTLYELFTGTVPFGSEGQPEELLANRRRADYRKIADVNPKISRRMSEFIDRMMSFAPADRPVYTEIISEMRREAGATKTGFMRRLSNIFRSS